MKVLSSCVAALAVMAGASTAMAGQPFAFDAETLEFHRERASIRDWIFGAILLTPIKMKDCDTDRRGSGIGCLKLLSLEPSDLSASTLLHLVPTGTRDLWGAYLVHWTRTRID